MKGMSAEPRREIAYPIGKRVRIGGEIHENQPTPLSKMHRQQRMICSASQPELIQQRKRNLRRVLNAFVSWVGKTADR